MDPLDLIARILAMALLLGVLFILVFDKWSKK